MNNVLRQLRDSNRWTQEQLAKKAKVASRTVHRAEKGDRIHHQSMRKLLKAFDLPFSAREAVFGVYGTPLIALPAAKAEQAEKTRRMREAVDIAASNKRQSDYYRSVGGRDDHR